MAFLFEAPELDPDEVSTLLQVRATSAARRGDERLNYSGHVVGVEEHGWWSLSTEGAVDSKDINEHFRYLRDRLNVTREILDSIAPNGRTYIDVLWESTYLYAGTGPLLDAEAIDWAAAVGAGMGFDIYQVADDENAV